MNLERKKMEDARRVAQGQKSQLTGREVRQAEYNISAMERIMLNAPGPKTTASPAPGRGPKKDTLRGLTHEAGTKSLLKGMLKFFQ